MEHDDDRSPSGFLPSSSSAQKMRQSASQKHRTITLRTKSGIDADYIIGKAEHDVRTAIVKASYYSMDVYAVGTLASIMKFFVFVVSLITGAALIFVLTTVTCWMEWLIILLVYIKIPHIRMAPFWLAVFQLALDVAYLLVWILIYWNDRAIAHGWWWSVSVVISAHILLTFEVALACANVSHSILGYHVVLTHMRALSTRFLETTPSSPLAPNLTTVTPMQHSISSL